MISDFTTSVALARPEFFSRLERMTSTRSLGRIKPPAPVSGDISVEMARMPTGRIAAMKPEPLAWTSLGSRIGSPAINGARAIQPAIWVVASGRSLRRMKLLLAVEAGQLCHCTFSGVTEKATAKSEFATRKSPCCKTRDGWDAWGLFLNAHARE